MIPELIDRYPEGSDLTIMNTFYSYKIFEDGKKISDDFIILIYKNNTTGKKEYKIIYNPTYSFYLVKNPEYQVDYNRLFIERDKVERIDTPFNELEKTLCEVTGNGEFYKKNIYDRATRKSIKLIHENPNVFMSDMQIENHYRFKFAQTYTNEINKLSKGFFDIEVDGINAVGDFVEYGECPINCVSFYDDKTDKVYTFILRNPENPLIEEFENEWKSNKYNTLNREFIHNFVIDNIGGKKAAEKNKLLNTNYELYFYDKEIELLSDLFSLMHRCSPDFIEGWNSSNFDIPYIIERIKVLGYDPSEIMCDQSWPVKIVKNFVDKDHLNEYAERGDWTFISGLPVFIDQMIQYASRRKAKYGSISSFKLDDVGLAEAKVRKLDYSHITTSVVKLPWLDFKTFVLYNIMDVIVQKCIENKANDLEYIFAKCVTNNTVYPKGHRQTVYLINRMANDWYKMGYIIGNNCNKNGPKGEQFLGALVGLPLNTNDYSKLKIDGRAIWVCDNLQDYDYKSLYPSIMAEFNIAPNTQIGKIVIDETIYKLENLYENDWNKYSRSGEFIENLVTDNHIEYCHRWFHLANFEEFLDDIDEFYNNIGGYNNLVKRFNVPIVPVSNNKTQPVSFNSLHSKTICPVVFDIERNSKYNYNDLILAKETPNGT